MTGQPVGLQAKTFIDVGRDGSFEQRVGLVVSEGLSDSFKILMTGEDGRLDPSIIPEQTEPGEAILALVNVQAGDFVHIGVANGARHIYGAVVEEQTVDGVKLMPGAAVGFVVESWQKGEMATVFMKGINHRVKPLKFVPHFSVVTGQAAILDPSAPGEAMPARNTPWSSLEEGMFLQQLGTIVEVASSGVRINFVPGPVIHLNTVISPTS